MATKEGSFITMPSPRTYTSVLAVPRSMARSLEKTPARRLFSIRGHPATYDCGMESVRQCSPDTERSRFGVGRRLPCPALGFSRSSSPALVAEIAALPPSTLQCDETRHADALVPTSSLWSRLKAGCHSGTACPG